MTKLLAGVLGPVVSPFDAEGGDLAAVPFRANVRAHIATGLAGVVIAGSTGEAALLDDRERQQLVEWARPLVPEDRWLMVGAGAESTRWTIRRCAEAAERGADAVLVIPPHYYGPAMTFDALVSHYRRVADGSPVPVVLYNIPKYVHFALEPRLVHELAAHGNIVGIKDSSGDLTVLGAYVSAQSPSFSVLTGHGGSLYAALEMGARGGVLAVSLFAGAMAMQLYSAFAQGDLAEAGGAQEVLQPLNRAIVGGLGVAGVKAALDVMGFAGGPVRAPLLPLTVKERAEVEALLHAAELSKVA